MIIVERLSAVAGLLLDAAKTGGVVSYSGFNALFDQDTNKNDKYDTLEAGSIQCFPAPARTSTFW